MRKILILILSLNVFYVYSSGWYKITDKFVNNNWEKITPIDMSYNEKTKEIVIYDKFFKVYYYTTIKKEKNKNYIKIIGDMKDSYQGKNTVIIYFQKNDSNTIEIKNYKTEVKYMFNTKK